ncbi:MAG: hypothetical protein ACE5OS_14135 [Anaerolineae bacterium]
MFGAYLAAEASMSKEGMIAGARERWQSILDHPILRLELRHIRRRRWWPGRRFFLFYPALLGAALGCGVMLAVTNSLGVQVAALVTGLPVVCLLSAVTWLLGLALPWIAPVLTAATIARERELSTLDLLRATLLSERGIVLGKLGGCLAQLWPGILTLALLTPFRVVPMAGSGLFDMSYLPVFMVDSMSDVEWGWLLLAGVAGMLRPWGDLALHTAVGLFVSALCRSSATAIAVSYAAIIVVRVIFWLATSFLGPMLLMLLVGPMEQMTTSLEYVLLFPGLASLGVVLVEVAGAALLVWGAVWWLKRV